MEVVHVQNYFPLISPSVYYAAARNRVPVIQSLRNYRLICLSGQLLRDGGPCEDCVGRHLPWPGVYHACYRNSRATSAVVGAMLYGHARIGTWRSKVTRYIALTDFARQKFIEGGLPEERVVVKPNFVDPDPGVGRGEREHALFVGRLAPEKGVEVLIDAWAMLDRPPPLYVLGDGPLEASLKKRACGVDGVTLPGAVDATEMMAYMRNARYAVIPSIWYETFGRVTIEAYACGTPVIASRLGSLEEMVDDGVTGLLFTPGDARDLAEKVRWAEAHPDEMREMGLAGRRVFEERFTMNRNYGQLMEIYEEARRAVGKAG